MRLTHRFSVTRYNGGFPGFVVATNDDLSNDFLEKLRDAHDLIGSIKAENPSFLPAGYQYGHILELLTSDASDKRVVEVKRRIRTAIHREYREQSPRTMIVSLYDIVYGNEFWRTTREAFEAADIHVFPIAENALMAEAIVLEPPEVFVGYVYGIVRKRCPMASFHYCPDTHGHVNVRPQIEV